ncbi:PHP domain-containing protein [Anaerovibrio sp.]|uniref:PHP domain-containing protein n=1 Tax=Anaerovibrio sp. TaxID=1872532 RepID=UPI003F155A30
MGGIKSKVDLHMHSNASDGRDRADELLAKVEAAGIECFALTDHDTIAGVLDMEKLLARRQNSENPIQFIRGIEFSCITALGKCHILGYGYDYQKEAFQAVLAKGEKLRREKLEKRLDFLRHEYGIAFAEEAVDDMRRRGSAGKPHLAELMVKQGVAASASEAIRNYINHCPTFDSRLPADEAIRAICDVGGVAVWAHPYGGVGEPVLTEQELVSQLELLLSFGLQGLECYYSRYDMEQTGRLVAYARKYKLRISGGSDYHGRKNFPDLGQLNTEGVAVGRHELSVV